MKNKLLAVMLAFLVVFGLLALAGCSFLLRDDLEQSSQAPGESLLPGDESSDGDGGSGDETAVSLQFSLIAENAYAVSGLGNVTDPDVVIPATYNGKPVTAIGAEAFKDAGITSISFGENITVIGASAFAGCTSMEGVYYEGGIADWVLITFADATANPLSAAHNLYINGEPVTDLVIPEGVTVIKAYAFYGITVVNVTINVTVIEIGASAFENSSIQGVSYTGGIADWVLITFAGAAANPLSAAHNLYINGELVTDLVIPEGVTVIKAYAFYGITVVNVTIHVTVVVINDNAFAGVTAEQVYFSGTADVWVNVEVGEGNGLLGDVVCHTHSYEESVTTPATCTEEGVKTWTCTCGDAYTEVIPMIAHSYVDYRCQGCNAWDPSLRENGVVFEGEYIKIDDEGNRIVFDGQFVEFEGSTYYVIDNQIVCGFILIGDHIYHFGATGAMSVNVQAGEYPIGPDGYIAGGFNQIELDGILYFVVDDTVYTAAVLEGKITESDHDLDMSNNTALSSVTFAYSIGGYESVITAVCDDQGAFSITVPAAEGRLSFTHEGYRALELTISAEEQTFMQVVMDRDVSNTLNGTVAIADSDTNSTNNTVLSGATVTLSRIDVPYGDTRQTTTDQSGRYSFTDLTAGVYSLTVERDGYQTVRQTLSLRYNLSTVQNMTLEAITANSQEEGFAAGTVVDASTGGAVAGLTIYIRSGINNVVGDPIKSVTTDKSGKYNTGALAPGNYTAEIADERTLENEDHRYGTLAVAIKVLPGVTISNQNATVSNSVNMSADSMRIVLTWGSSPSDLDSHLNFKLNNGSSYHVYYNNTSESSASLDVDDTSSYGPETITISSFGEGVYTYYVHNYSSSSSSSALSNSGATVQVFLGGESAPAYTFYVPSGSGRYWNVFTYNSVSGDFVVNNRIEQSAPTV